MYIKNKKKISKQKETRQNKKQKQDHKKGTAKIQQKFMKYENCDIRKM